MSIERGKYEQDPSYDPERLAGSPEKNAEKLERDVFGEHENESGVFRNNELDPNREDEDVSEYVTLGKIVRIAIPEYEYDIERNPFAFDTENPKDLASVAERLNTEIQSRFEGKNILVRGLQSGHFTLQRNQLIKSIVAHGGDHVFARNEEADTMYALDFTQWSSESTVLKTLEGFHKFKPKSEERPHYPVDIWMIFDAASYDNVEYLHPRHNVIARDKWQAKSPERGLQTVFIIN
jgi:hypothetical protein